MVRPTLSLTIAIALCSANTELSAQNQIANLFKVKNHDYGVMSRGAKHDYAFTFKNTLTTPIRFSGVTQSCRCVTPIIKTPVVNPGETGEILVQFNTLSFTGNRKSTITLNVSQPRFMQVQLHIKGYVRTDIVVSTHRCCLMCANRKRFSICET